MSQILSAPDPRLSEKAKPVKTVDRGITKFIEQLKIALASASDPIGVGLAAPQVGKNIDIFVAKPTFKSPAYVFINPKIIKREGPEKTLKEDKIAKLEGCLSLPNIWGDVRRYREISLEYLDESGKKHRRKFSGFLATIIQHEYDHLNGILFPKRVLEQGGTLYKSEKNDEGEDVFEELKI